MKKSSFIALLMGTVSGVLFALGMCMALLPQWDAFAAGVVLGGAGLLLALVTFVVWSRMEGKALPKMSMKNALHAVYATVAVLVFGGGMCLCLVWQQMVWGTLVGLLGMVMLIALIPMIKGLK